MKRFKGFTMTELMVALAVIGIIVAVVTPAIMKTRPNKNKMMVKKTFYTTEQIVSTLINDARLYPDMRELCYEDGYTEAEDFYCAWGFDYQNDVNYEGDTYGGSTKFRDLFVSRLNLNSSKTDKTNSVYYTTDGVKWGLDDTVGKWSNVAASVKDAGTAIILVDVNGEDEPNCLQQNCSDPDDFDQYRINVYVNGKLEIDKADTKAIEYATINTSIRDGL